jgi:hypothetical protein
VPHLDPDRLVLLALAEDIADETESAHLAVCAGCRAEIDDLKQIADLGSETQDLRDLPPPPERVWSAIKADLSVRAAAPIKRKKRRWLAPPSSPATSCSCSSATCR